MNQAETQAVEKSSRFWDRNADRYAKKPIADLDAYHTLVLKGARIRASSPELLAPSAFISFRVSTFGVPR